MNPVKMFEEIAENAGADAAAVKCSLGEYIEGLETIISFLEGSLEAARADLKREEDDLQEHLEDE